MRKNIILLLLLSTFTFLVSCENVMDIHKDFIKDGEIVYATKPDTVYLVAGKNRLELNYKMFNATNVKYVKVYWNDYQDSLVHNASFAPDTVYDKIMITNLEEQSYTFNIQTEDQDGNKSLRTTAFGTSYGDVYQSTLINRRIESFVTEDDGGRINWYSAPSGLVRNEIRYTNSNGNIYQVSMTADLSNVFCEGAKIGTSIEYRSVYIPEKLSVDTFYTDWARSEDVFPYPSADISRSNWQVIFYDNSHPSEGSPNNIIDNNPSSYWHSNYSTPTNYPYTFVIDMKEPIWVREVGAQSRQGTYYTRGVEFYITNDYNGVGTGTWTKLGGVNLEKKNDMQWTSCATSLVSQEIRGRYLKVVLTSGYSGHLGALSEVTVRKVRE